MCADDHVGFFIAFHQRQETFFLSRGSTDRQFHSERFQPAPQHGVMLLSQDLGRRHECRLITRFNGQQDRCDCNDGFSRADISL